MPGAIIVPAATLLHALSLLNAITPPTLRTTTLIIAYTAANSAYLRLVHGREFSSFLKWKYHAHREGEEEWNQPDQREYPFFFVVAWIAIFNDYFQGRRISKSLHRDCDTEFDRELRRVLGNKGFSKNAIFLLYDQKV